MTSIDVKHRFIELRAKGWSYDKISKEIGKAKQTLIDWAKDYNEEIANLKALQLEALYEKYYLQKEHRLIMFGGVLSRIKEELSKRDLSEIPTDKLLDLLLKYDNQVKEELVEPTIKTSKELKEDKQDRELLESLTEIHYNTNTRLKVG